MNANRLLIDALLHPDVYPHPVDHCELIETHISWVILAGGFVYKIKKPVDMGFLDFSTLAKRKFYCEEELRLNHRLAPDIYLDVVTINGSETKPAINGAGEIIEYAVKMKAFPQSAQLDVMLEQGQLGKQHIDSFAQCIAAFHQQLDTGNDNDYGWPDHVLAPTQENFVQIRRNITNKIITEKLQPLQNWVEQKYQSLKTFLEKRKQDGFVRECHGDMHCRNLAWVDNKPVIFDCIEFNPELRWIDVISEIAFLVMDLQERDQEEYAQRLLNTYLQYTGDYAGLQVLSFYLVYRALVRAKVCAIRSQQSGLTATQLTDIEQDIVRYLDLAQSYTHRTTPQLIITHGLSASGKSTITQSLLQKLPALRVRSDVERKRLFALQANSEAGAATGQGIYTQQATQATYDRLLTLAALIINAGYSVIVDATFLDRQWRMRFEALATEHEISFVILHLHASTEILKQRVAARPHTVSDADMAVLEHQLAHYQPLEYGESGDVITVDTSMPVDSQQLVVAIHSRQWSSAE